MLKYVIHTKCGMLARHTIGMTHQKYVIHTYAHVLHTSFLTVCAINITVLTVHARKYVFHTFSRSYQWYVMPTYLS